MHKILYISVLMMIFFMPAAAQKKFVYEDSSLLQMDEEQISPVPEVEVQPADTALVYDEEYAGSDDMESVDTSLYLNNLYLSVDSVNNWRNLKHYAYLKNLDSLLKNKPKEKPARTRSSSGPGFFDSLLSSRLISVLLWSLAIFFVLFIIYRLFLAEGVFQRKTKSLKNAEAAVEEEVITSESDFDELIKQALKNGSFRLAVRYQYLRTLHKLADKNMLELAPDKTNYQYVREIASSQHQNEFASLTLSYEYVWYGEFEINQDTYRKIDQGFTDLNQKI